MGAKAARKDAEAEARATKQRLKREAIDGEEATWLAERILHDGAIDENERALLTYLKKEAQGRPGAQTPVHACENLSRPITLSARLTEYQGNPGLAARPSLREAIPVLTS